VAPPQAEHSHAPSIDTTSGSPPIVVKRVQFYDETWVAIETVARERGRGFQDLADEAFADFLKKHDQPVGLRAERRASCEDGSRTQPIMVSSRFSSSWA
jgi:hypothetical protein